MLNDGLKTTIADRLMQLSEKIGMHSEDCDKRELCLNRLTVSWKQWLVQFKLVTP